MKRDGNCSRCGIEFKPRRPSSGQHFCSRSCYWKFRKENHMLPPSRRGTHITARHKTILKEWHKNHPEAAKRLKQLPVWNKGKILPDQRGENHWNWKGGRINPDYRQRHSAEYIDWRKAVFERDNYICQICGCRGHKLHADHIKPFVLYPELRLVIDNGRTLCAECHYKTPTYGRPKRILEALL